MAGSERRDGAGPPPAGRSDWWTAQWRRWCASRQLDVAYGATVAAVVAYLFGLLLVVLFVLRHTEPAMTTVDILFLAVSTITQAGMLPLMFINVSTWGHVVLFAALALSSAFLINTLAPTVVAEVRLRQLARAQALREGTAPGAALRLRVLPADAAWSQCQPAQSWDAAVATARDWIDALWALRYAYFAYYVAVQGVFLVVFTIVLSTSPALLLELDRTENTVMGWSTTQTLSAFHQVPFITDTNLIATSTNGLGTAAVLVPTALLVLAGNMLAPAALHVLLSALARRRRREVRRLNVFRLALDRAALLSPHVLPRPHVYVLLALVALGIGVHAIAVLAVGGGIDAVWAPNAGPYDAPPSAAQRVFAAAFSAVGIRTAGLTALFVPALPLLGQLIYVCSMFVGAGAVAAVRRLPPGALGSTGRSSGESATPTAKPLTANAPNPAPPVTATTSASSLVLAVDAPAVDAATQYSPLPLASPDAADWDLAELPLSAATAPPPPPPWAGSAAASPQPPSPPGQSAVSGKASPTPAASVVQQVASFGTSSELAAAAVPAATPPPRTSKRQRACQALQAAAGTVWTVSSAVLHNCFRDIGWLALALLLMVMFEQNAALTAADALVESNSVGLRAPPTATPSAADGGPATYNDLLVRLLFDLTSAYGLIGLSLASAAYAAAGVIGPGVVTWSAGTKVVLMAVMVLGRIRTFPPAPLLLAEPAAASGDTERRASA